MSMSIPYMAVGRAGQKARTRAALVEATRRLLAEGRTPTVEEAASAAAISRATAYRYFPNQRALLVATYPEIQRGSLLGQDAPAEVEDRLAQAVGEFTRLVVNHEPELRMMLRLSLETTTPEPSRVPLRQGRAIAWLEDALGPLRSELTSKELRRLILAIRSATGIEAFVWLTDIAGLSRADAVQLMRWSARSLLRAARSARPMTRPRP